MTDSPGTAVPRVAAKARLEWDDVRQRHVLLYPEGLVALNAGGNAAGAGPCQGIPSLCKTRPMGEVVPAFGQARGRPSRETPLLILKTI